MTAGAERWGAAISADKDDHSVYTYQSAGRANIERMKLLAASGRGLSTFISTTVRKLYASCSR